MCNCALCCFNRTITAIFPSLPAEQAEVFALVLDNHNNVGMDLDYSRAVVDGVWHSADEVIAHARERRKQGQISRRTHAAQESKSRFPQETGANIRHLDAVPPEHRETLSNLLLSHSMQFVELAALDAIIDGSDPAADEKLENARARRAQRVANKAQAPGAAPIDGESVLYQRVWVINDPEGGHVMTCPDEPSEDFIKQVEARIAKTCSVVEFVLVPAGVLNNPVYQYRFCDLHADPDDDGRWSKWRSCTLDEYKQAKEAADAGRGNQVRVLYALA